MLRQRAGSGARCSSRHTTVTEAIIVDGITKVFRLPVDRSTTLKYRFTHWRSASRYNALYALRGVTFSVPDGQFLGIIGRNGSGKSTLLKILSRIYVPTSGSRVDQPAGVTVPRARRGLQP